MTFNLVPSLLVQLEAFAAGPRARPVPRLESQAGRRPRPTTNRLHPRELLPRAAAAHDRRLPALRASCWRCAADAADRGGSPRRRRRFSARRSPRPAGLAQAGVDRSVLPRCGRADPRRSSTRAAASPRTTRRTLREVELEMLNRVDPRVPRRAPRAARSRCRRRRSTTRFCRCCATRTSTCARIPTRGVPRQRFVHPEDAAEQLERAVACHERLFGAGRSGCGRRKGRCRTRWCRWSRRPGFQWMATDELILARTLGITFTRDGRGHVEQPERLYAPYRVGGRRRQVACAFRDHVLSDLIGFTYAGWDAEAAADDFVARLVEAGRRYADARAGERRSSRSSSTARTPGSTSRAAAARSCGRSTAGCPRTPSSGP